jgi:hypothetical protein
MWRSLVARFVRDEEVVGSNPAIPTLPTPVSLHVRAPGSFRSRAKMARWSQKWSQNTTRLITVPCGHPRLSADDQAGDQVRGSCVHRWIDVAVDVESHRDLGVAQALLDDLRMDAAL